VKKRGKEGKGIRGAGWETNLEKTTTKKEGKEIQKKKIEKEGK